MLTAVGMTMSLLMSNIMAMLRDGHATPSPLRKAHPKYSANASTASRAKIAGRPGSAGR